MDTRQIRDIRVLLPSDDPDTRAPITAAPARGDLSDITVTSQDWSRIRLEGRNLSGSRLSAVVMAEAHIEDARITNSILQDCDLASSRWTNTKIDRCVLRGCRLTGVQAHQVTLADVIFERCRLDYALLNRLQATGAVAFLDCLMRQTTIEDSKLDNAMFADCTMTDLHLARSRLRGADLRGSQLDTLTGITSLAGVTIDTGQIQQLTHTLLTDLQINVND